MQRLCVHRQCGEKDIIHLSDGASERMLEFHPDLEFFEIFPWHNNTFLFTAKAAKSVKNLENLGRLCALHGSFFHFAPIKLFNSDWFSSILLSNSSIRCIKRPIPNSALVFT